MRRLAHVILAVVVAFVLVVAATLYARTRAREVEPVVGPAPVKADLNVKEVRIEEETGKVRWRLTAEQALVFEEEGRTNLQTVAVQLTEPTRSWTIVGDEADLSQRRQNLELRRNVVVTSSDGLRLETTVLRWVGNQKRLWTDAPVKISRDNSVIYGRGLEVMMEEEKTTIGGRVRATFLTAKQR
jgi:LPS export ABC transporter protein LptC